jgi:hypothetical protein
VTDKASARFGNNHTPPTDRAIGLAANSRSIMLVTRTTLFRDPGESVAETQPVSKNMNRLTTNMRVMANPVVVL